MDFERELERVAKQYRDGGYTVTVRPAPDQLPTFATEYRIDLLADRGDGRALVRVVRDRGELEADPSVIRQAEVTNAQPGWQYDLVVLGPYDPLRRDIREFGEPSAEQIDRMVDEAGQVLRVAGPRPAFVLAWAALEAAMRRTRPGGRQANLQPPVALGELYANGLLSREEYDRLQHARRVRSAVVHGLAPPHIEPGMVQSVVDTARRLLAGADAAPAAAG